MGESETLTLQPNRRTRWIFVIAFFIAIPCTTFLALADIWGAWIFIPIFILGMILALVDLLVPNASYLRLTSEGFTIRTTFRDQFYRWSDIESFGTVKTRRSNYVTFTFVPTFSRQTWSQKLTRNTVGYDGNLPETYGMELQELADLMNKWKTRAS